ncbi:MAG: hypothetical protein NTZ05_00380 [Chloroflexi bacterium]|nr:hypothetical protein [Chloroflexota bacterium]
MSKRHRIKITPRIRAALDELQATIARNYPAATFQVTEGDDPTGIYLRVTVDVEDTDDVVDVYIDRLVDLQVEEHLPVYVLTLQSPERDLAGSTATNG